MAIRPIDVRRKEFKSGFRGYDANEVDDFLDGVADEFERAYSDNQRMTEEISSLKGRLEQFEELEGAIREALVHAQQVARDLRRNANKEAELVVREAKEQAHRILADSSARVERVQQSYEALQKAKHDFQGDFRHLLKTYLTVMENADVASAKEIEASLRERLDTESIAVAHQAAETQRMDAPPGEETQAGEPAQAPAAQPGPDAGAGDEADDATQRIEQDASGPLGETDDRAGERRDPEPETTDREEEPPAVGEAPGSEETQRREAPFAPVGPTGSAADPGAADEVDREEPMPAGEDRSSNDFFDKSHDRPPEEEREEESRIFRASRFLRRRG